MDIEKIKNVDLELNDITQNLINEIDFFRDMLKRISGITKKMLKNE